MTTRLAHPGCLLDHPSGGEDASNYAALNAVLAELA